MAKSGFEPRSPDSDTGVLKIRPLWLTLVATTSRSVHVWGVTTVHIPVLDMAHEVLYLNTAHILSISHQSSIRRHLITGVDQF